MSRVTRRELLAGLALGGAAVGGGLAAGGALAAPPAYTRYTYAQADGVDAVVQLAWYATYNGDVLTEPADAETALDPATGPYVDATPAGPVVDLRNALPGDEGTLAVGVFVEEGRPVELDLLLATDPTGFTENGRHEPERAAGDTSDDRGELQEYLAVVVGRDDGSLGLGRCDGRIDAVFEPFAGRGDYRTLASLVSDGVVATETGDGLAGGRVYRLPADGCLGPGDRACVALAWQLPVTDDDNRYQTDGAGLGLRFVARNCGGQRGGQGRGNGNENSNGSGNTSSNGNGNGNDDATGDRAENRATGGDR